MTATDLFTETQLEILFENGKKENWRKNHIPVAYLRIKGLGFRFLVTELCADNPDIAFGLCDYDSEVCIDIFRISKLKELAEEKGNIVENKLDFTGKYNLAVYAKVATDFGTMLLEDDTNPGKKLFSYFNKGKNSDLSQNVLNLKPALVW